MTQSEKPMMRKRARGAWRWFGRGLVALGLALAAAALYVALVPTRLMEAVYIMIDVAAGESATPLKRRTSAPRTERVIYDIGDKTHRALIVRPANAAPRAAIVLVPGAVPDGPDDPRLQAFAGTLARARFLVLIPDSPSMRQLLLSPQDADTVADAVRYLVDRRRHERFGRIGISAVSYAVGPSVIAALRADVREQVNFVFGIGGYFSMIDAIRYLTTGHFRAPEDGPGAPWREGAPDSVMIWRFILYNAVLVEPPRDQVALMALARVKMRDLLADPSPFLEALGEEAAAVYALASNRNPDRVERLIAALPTKLRQGMHGLDLATRDLSPLKARLILVHGRDDRIIPPGESIRLAAAAPRDRVRLFLLDALVHAHLGPLDLPDLLRMWRATSALLDERDETAAGR
jgi:hypothetical protein